MLAGEPGARQDQAGVSGGDLDRDAGADAPPLARAEVGRWIAGLVEECLGRL